MSASTTNQISPIVTCPSCGGLLTVSSQNVVNHLWGIPNICRACRATLDWWQITRHAINDNFLGHDALGFAGAQTKLFIVELRPQERTVYRFSDHGIPLGAKVLHINYTPQGGGLFPLEIIGNVPTRRVQLDEVVLYPAPLGNSPLEPTRVAVLATWIPPDDELDESWQSLYDAFEAFTVDKYLSVIVPANVAVESSLRRLMVTLLNGTVGRKRIDDFLDNAATYGHQLNVLLPVFAEAMHFPQLSREIVGFLNRLRSIRNNLAHGGGTKLPPGRKEVADLLSAALFAFHYIRHLQVSFRTDRHGRAG